MSQHRKPPGSIAALEALGEEFDRALPTLDRAPARLEARDLLMLAAFLVAVAAFMSLTGPGRALAERIGGLVGIGEPSSVQERDLRDPRLSATQERLGPAIVAATGTIPGGEEFEIVAWAARETDRSTPVPVAPQGDAEESVGESKPGQVLSCLGVVYPGLGEQQTGKLCLGEGEALDSPVHVFAMGVAGPAGVEGAGELPYQVIGATDPDVDRVSVTYENEAGSRVEAPVAFGTFDDEILERTGATEPYGLFVAIVPYDGASKRTGGLIDSPHLQTVAVTGFSEEGDVLGRDDAGASYLRALRRGDRRARPDR